jgi:hypothetical protein
MVNGLEPPEIINTTIDGLYVTSNQPRQILTISALLASIYFMNFQWVVNTLFEMNLFPFIADPIALTS